jgi:hypothetical protein
MPVAVWTPISQARSARASMAYQADARKAAWTVNHHLPDDIDKAAMILRHRANCARTAPFFHDKVSWSDAERQPTVSEAIEYARELKRRVIARLDGVDADRQPQSWSAHADAAHLHVHGLFLRVDTRTGLVLLSGRWSRPLREENQRLAAEYGFLARPERRQLAPHDVVNAETWTARVSFSRWLRSALRDATDPVQADTILLRLGVRREFRAGGMRFVFEDNHGKIWLAKGSYVFPPNHPGRTWSALEWGPAPTSLAKPQFTYADFLRSPQSLMPFARNHPRLVEWERLVEQGERPGPLGIFLRRSTSSMEAAVPAVADVPVIAINDTPLPTGIVRYVLDRNTVPQLADDPTSREQHAVLFHDEHDGWTMQANGKALFRYTDGTHRAADLGQRVPLANVHEVELADKAVTFTLSGVPERTIAADAQRLFVNGRQPIEPTGRTSTTLYAVDGERLAFCDYLSRAGSWLLRPCRPMRVGERVCDAGAEILLDRDGTSAMTFVAQGKRNEVTLDVGQGRSTNREAGSKIAVFFDEMALHRSFAKPRNERTTTMEATVQTPREVKGKDANENVVIGGRDPEPEETSSINSIGGSEHDDTQKEEAARQAAQEHAPDDFSNFDDGSSQHTEKEQTADADALSGLEPIFARYAIELQARGFTAGRARDLAAASRELAKSRARLARNATVLRGSFSADRKAILEDLKALAAAQLAQAAIVGMAEAARGAGVPPLEAAVHSCDVSMTDGAFTAALGRAATLEMRDLGVRVGSNLHAIGLSVSKDKEQYEPELDDKGQPRKDAKGKPILKYEEVWRWTWIAEGGHNKLYVDERMNGRFHVPKMSAFKNSPTDRVRAVDTALLLAGSRYGGRIDIKGEKTFCELAVKRAVALGLVVTTPELKNDYLRELEKAREIQKTMTADTFKQSNDPAEIRKRVVAHLGRDGQWLDDAQQKYHNSRDYEVVGTRTASDGTKLAILRSRDHERAFVVGPLDLGKAIEEDIIKVEGLGKDARVAEVIESPKREEEERQEKRQRKREQQQERPGRQG